MSDEPQSRADAIVQRRNDLDELRGSYVGDPIFEKLDTLTEAIGIVGRLPEFPGNETLIQCFSMARQEIERLAVALLMIAQESIVPDAFGDRAKFEQLDELRQIHASALLIAHGALQGGDDDRDDAAVEAHVPG